LLLAGGLVAQEASGELDDVLQQARASYSKGDYGTTRKHLDRAWTLAQQMPRDEPRRYQVLKLLFSVSSAAGEYTDAEKYLQQAINWRENPKPLDDLTELAMLCRRMGDPARGLGILQTVMGSHTRSEGLDSPLVADDYSRMALLYMDAKEPEKAAQTLETAIEIREKPLGVEHPGLLTELDRLGSTWVILREYEKAELVYRRALVIRERAVGAENPDLIPTVEGLGYSCFGQKKYAEAEPFYNRLLKLWESAGGKDHPMVALTLDKMAVFYRAQNRWEDAAAATVRSNVIRALFLAAGLNQEAAFRLLRDDRKAAARLFQKALNALDRTVSDHDELRLQIEASLKELVGSPRKTAPVKK